MKEEHAWIGVDFDGTLATTVTKEWDGPLGEPIAPMVDRVKRWLAEGRRVKILTARMSPYDDGGRLLNVYDILAVERRISEWCKEHVGSHLPVTESKDHNMIELWDDKAIGVVRDTGEIRTDISRQIQENSMNPDDSSVIHPTPSPFYVHYPEKDVSQDRIRRMIATIVDLQRRVGELEKQRD